MNRKNKTHESFPTISVATESPDANTSQVASRAGFTLMELLMVVIIVGILTSIALPQYTLSIERSRATEAMLDVKAINDAVYAYAAGRTGSTVCPNSFKKLVVSINGSLTDANTKLKTRDFTYELNKATNFPIPGTDCPGVVATRTNTKYDYKLWNPYRAGTSGEGASLACTGSDGKGRKICDSLQIYTSESPF